MNRISLDDQGRRSVLRGFLPVVDLGLLVLPPFLIEHGAVDCVVPYQGSVALHEVIESAAGPNRSRLVIVPGSGHYAEFDAAGQIPTVLAFLAETIGSRP